MEYIYDYNTLKYWRFLRKIRNYKTWTFFADQTNWLGSVLTLGSVLLVVFLFTPGGRQALNNATSFINGPPFMANLAQAASPNSSNGDFDLGSARIVTVLPNNTCILRDDNGNEIRVPVPAAVSYAQNAGLNVVASQPVPVGAQATTVPTLPGESPSPTPATIVLPPLTPTPVSAPNPTPVPVPTPVPLPVPSPLPAPVPPPTTSPTPLPTPLPLPLPIPSLPSIHL